MDSQMLLYTSLFKFSLSDTRSGWHRQICEFRKRYRCSVLSSKYHVTFEVYELCSCIALSNFINLSFVIVIVRPPDIQGEHKKVAPLWLSLIFQQCVKIFAWNFTQTVKQSNIHFITKFGWNLSKNDKLMLFQPRQPPISQHSEHYFHR